MNRRSILKSIFVAPLAALLGTKIVHGMDDNRSARIVLPDSNDSNVNHLRETFRLKLRKFTCVVCRIGTSSVHLYVDKRGPVCMPCYDAVYAPRRAE